MTKLASNIRTLREQRGLTQQELGLRCGVDGSAVSLWEASKTAPRAAMLAKVAAALDATVGELYGEAA